MEVKKEVRNVHVIHLPAEFPDGRKVEDNVMDAYLDDLTRRFGGETPDDSVPRLVPRLVQGRWLSNGQIVREPMHRFEIAVRPGDDDALEKWLCDVGRDLSQQVMYFVKCAGEGIFLQVDRHESEADNPVIMGPDGQPEEGRTSKDS